MGRKSNGPERRDQIAAGLLTVMAKVGYDAATVPLIAKAARLTPGLVHYHYTGKEEILVAVAALIGQRVNQRLDEHCRGEKDHLPAYIEVLLGRRYKDPELMRAWLVLSAEATRHPKVASAFAKVVDALLRRLILIVDERLPKAKKKEARNVSAAIFASVQGYYVLAAASPAAIPAGTATRNVKTMARALIAERAG
jgi:TetR/AcrR family transcriptional repressor of bet genes